MKKRLVILGLVMILLMGMLVSCEGANPQDNNALEMGNFKAIEDEEGMVYNKDTRVVYYMFSTFELSGNAGFGYTYFAPYISENGRFCRYINDEIVEIVPDTNNN